MESSDKTAREIYEAVKSNPARKRFGFGRKAVLVNIDPQKAYTRTDLFATAYETDPRQMEYIDTLAKRFRALGWPVVWTHVAYMDSGEDAGIWGTRTDTPDSLQNIKFGSERSEFDDRLDIDPDRDSVVFIHNPEDRSGHCGIVESERGLAENAITAAGARVPLHAFVVVRAGDECVRDGCCQRPFQCMAARKPEKIPQHSQCAIDHVAGWRGPVA